MYKRDVDGADTSDVIVRIRVSNYFSRFFFFFCFRVYQYDGILNIKKKKKCENVSEKIRIDETIEIAVKRRVKKDRVKGTRNTAREPENGIGCDGESVDNSILSLCGL